MQRKVIYFDPFGVVPPSAILVWSKKTNKAFSYWPRQVQDFDTNTCGYYCIEVAKQLNNKVDFGKITDLYKKSPAQNDHNITQRWLPLLPKLGLRAV